MTKIFNFLIGGSAKVLNNSTPIVLIIVLTRFGGLSVQMIGQIAYLFVFLAFVGLVAPIGMVEGVQKFLAEKVSQQLPTKDLVSSVLTLNAATSFIVATVVFGLEKSFHTFNLYNGMSELLLLGVIFFSCYHLIIPIFNGLGQSIRFGVYQIINSFLIIVVTFVSFFVLRIDPVQSCLFGILCGWGITSLLCLVDLFRQGNLHSKPKLPPKDFIHFCISNLASLIALTLITQTDSIFIVAFGGDKSLELNGLYKSISQLGKFPMVVALMVYTPMLPIFVRQVSEGSLAQLKKTYTIGSGVILGFGGLMVAVCALFSKNILNIIYNNPAIEAQNGLLPVLIGYSVLQGWFWLIMYFWEATNHVQLLRNAVWAQFVLYFLGMIFVLPLGIFTLGWYLLILQIIQSVYWQIKFINLTSLT